MKTRTSSHMVTAILLAGLLSASAIRADDSAPVWQYELGLGGKRPVSTFYLSYRQSDGGHVALSELNGRPALRIPLYSTDSRKPSIARQLSLLMNAADDDGPPDGDSASVKEAFVGLLAAVVVLGPPVVGMVKTIKELDCIPYCDSGK